MTGDSDNDAKTRTKSPKAFRTISEAARELDLPQHVLRFWETKFPQIKPMKRAGGRRFYRPEDVQVLERIKTLLHTEGYTIKGVQKLLRQNGGALQAANQDTPQPASPEPSEGTIGENLKAEISAAIGKLESARADLASTRESS